MKLRPALTLLVWLLAAANLYYFRIADPDLWWYLRCGEDILQSGQIHQVDHYSFTAAGLPYLNHEWLTQVLFAFLFQHGGSAALVWLKLAVGIGFLIVFHRLIRLHSDDPRINLPALLLAAHAVGRFLLFRPQSFSFLFFASVLYLLELQRIRPTRAIWLLPMILCLWANMHAAFAVGIALVGYYWLVLPLTQPAPDRRFSGRLGVAFGLCCLATLVNPYGYDLWTYVGREALNPLNKLYVNEWQQTQFIPLSWNSGLFLCVLAAAASVGIASRKRDWGDVVLLLIFAALGFSAPRHIPFFAIVAIPMFVKWFDEFTTRQAENPRLNLVLAGWLGLVLVPVLLTAYFSMLDPRPRIRIVDEHYKGFPYEAVEFLRQQPTGGNVWNELAWGGYLMWELAPKWKTSLDGRNITLYPRQVVRDHFELLSPSPPDLSVLQRYPIDLCLISRERRLSGLLEASADWQKMYEDQIAVIFRSRGSKLTNLVASSGLTIEPRPTELFLQPR